MNFRLIIQPVMAIIFAVLDGRKDALQKRPYYFWALFTDVSHRREMLESGWHSVGKVFILAIALDVYYQYRNFHWFYPEEALVGAIILALVPYLLLRGPVNHLIRLIRR